ncbi:MAG: hypothetical protein B9S36_02990 [Verrucomicrobiia bacterium Tous-C2TDCM]|nr:MAG: hypothetical protein B9S36_02990 [Verrucomicrobiae bacterium Tous-C2TDCM]
MPPSEHSPNWDNLYREKTTPWDKGAPAPPLLEWIGANPSQIGGRVLVPGCGLGHDVRALAALADVTSVVGLDLSPTAVALAAEFSKVGRESYLTGDLFALDDAHLGTYDWVWEHTCFCAIEPSMREEYVRAVHGSLKPGAGLLGVFYLDPYDDEHQPGGGPPHGCSIGELSERFERSDRFRIEESFVPTRSYPGREGLERLVRMRRL